MRPTITDLTVYDVQWIVLSLWKMADYKNNRGIGNAGAFMVRQN